MKRLLGWACLSFILGFIVVMLFNLHADEFVRNGDVIVWETETDEMQVIGEVNEALAQDDLLILGTPKQKGARMKNYIGTKIVKAEPMSENAFRNLRNRPTLSEDKDGYYVIYPDGYKSWSPKDVFEQAYRELSCGELTLLWSRSEKEEEQATDPL